MIVVVGGIKGGSGKTTVATNLAVIRAGEGRDVLLIDADDQETASDFTILRNERQAGTARYTSIKLTGAAVRTETLRLRGKYDDIVIDTGGRDTTSQRAALTVADILLVPFVPRSFDVWTLEKVAALVTEMRAANPELRACAFLNRADELAHSLLGRTGHAIEPLVRPLGYDWKIGVSIAASFAAREVFVSTMGTIYGVGDGSDDGMALAERLRAERNPKTGRPYCAPVVIKVADPNDPSGMAMVDKMYTPCPTQTYFTGGSDYLDESALDRWQGRAVLTALVQAEGHLADLAGDDHHWNGIHQGVGDARNRIGRAGARCDEDDAGLPGRAGIAFGGMGCSLLMPHEDVANPLLLEQGVIDRENGTARIAENDLHTEIAQRLDEDISS